MVGALQRSFRLNEVQPTDCLLFSPDHPSGNDSRVRYIQRLYEKRFLPKEQTGAFLFTTILFPYTCDAVGCCDDRSMFHAPLEAIPTGTVLIRRPRATISRCQAWAMEAVCLLDIASETPLSRRQTFMFWATLFWRLARRADRQQLLSELRWQNSGFHYRRWLHSAGVELPAGPWFPARIASDDELFQTLDRLRV